MASEDDTVTVLLWADYNGALGLSVFDADYSSLSICTANFDAQ